MEQDILREEILNSLSRIDQLWPAVLLAVGLTIFSMVALNFMYRRN